MFDDLENFGDGTVNEALEEMKHALDETNDNRTDDWDTELSWNTGKLPDNVWR